MEKLIQQFENAISEHKKTLECIEEVFINLKTREMKKVEASTRRQMLCMIDVEDAIEGLKRQIVEECKERGCEEHRIACLLPFMTVEEKEKITTCQREVFRLEGELVTGLRRNQRQIEILMAPSAAVVEVFSETMEREVGKGNAGFYDRKI